MIIYIATSGVYSDYCIEEVFTNKEQALIYCAANKCELEEYEADRLVMDTSKPVKDEWNAFFNFEGDFLYMEHIGLCFEKDAKLQLDYRRFKTVLNFLTPIDTDYEHAKKIACDVCAQEIYKAVEEGRYPWIRQHKEV